MHIISLFIAIHFIEIYFFLLYLRKDTPNITRISIVSVSRQYFMLVFDGDSNANVQG